jgi:hypothetical protein
MATAPREAMLSAMSAQFTTQAAYSAAIALAMVTAGLSKRRLTWKRRPRKRKKGR